MTFNAIEKNLIRVSRLLYEKRMIFGSDGNLSVLLPDGDFLVTPSGKHKGFLKKGDMALVAADGKVVKGRPSSEWLMHQEIYRRCPLAKAVIHAHPPHAVAWSIARPEMKELPAGCMSEIILAVGSIPIAPFAMPGTADMGSSIKPFLPDNRVIVLARHGAISWGEDLEEAFIGMERLESSAEILFKAELLGGVTSLPDHYVNILKDKRRIIGLRSL